MSEVLALNNKVAHIPSQVSLKVQSFGLLELHKNVGKVYPTKLIMRMSAKQAHQHTLGPELLMEPSC